MAVGLSATPSANAFIPLSTLVSVLLKSCPPRLPLVTQNEGVAWFDCIKTWVLGLVKTLTLGVFKNQRKGHLKTGKKY